VKTQNLQIAAGSGSITLASAAGRILNASFRETTGAAGAIFQILDGHQPGADIVLTYSLTANESVRDIFGSHGLPVQDGIRFNLISGTVEGSVNAAFETDYQDHCEKVIVLQMPTNMGQ